jgi:hypothetical protein
MDEEQHAADHDDTGRARTLAAAGCSFLDTDRRDWRAEAIEQCADGLAYLAAGLVLVEGQRG